MSILRNKITALVLAAGITAAPLAHGENVRAPALTPAQKTEVEKVIQDYLLKNPEILIQMTQLLQRQQMKAQQDRIVDAVPAQAAKLFNTAHSPTAGNSQGKVTLVEFFDYQCGHCRRMEPTINALPGKHDNLRVIYKVYPIFGEESEFASRAALAAKRQGKFDAMHAALMKLQPPLDKKKVLSSAKAAGLDTKKLKKDMTHADVTAEIKANYELANALGIKGTPSYLISNPDIPATTSAQKTKEVVFLPGAVDAETLDNMIGKFD